MKSSLVYYIIKRGFKGSRPCSGIFAVSAFKGTSHGLKPRQYQQLLQQHWKQRVDVDFFAFLDVLHLSLPPSVQFRFSLALFRLFENLEIGTDITDPFAGTSELATKDWRCDLIPIPRKAGRGIADGGHCG